jgi:biotin-dependent carboxylase-like uncharacterized protein
MPARAGLRIAGRVPPPGGASRQLRLTCQKLIGGHIRGVCCRFIEGLIADSDPGLSFDPVQAAQREDGLVPAVGYPGRCHGRAATRMSAGDTIEIGVPSAGLRTYIAVRGGVDVPPVLGSRSTDTMSWLGPARIVTGTTLPIGAVRVGNRPRVPVSVPSQRLGRPLRLILGPRQDWFDPEAIAAIGSREYVVTLASNRAGIRLQGPTLQRCRQEELPSEGVVTGAVQVPPSGQPIVLFRDRPTTGGYPVIGVVVEEDLSIVAQRRPGSTVRFVIVDR